MRGIIFFDFSLAIDDQKNTKNLPRINPYLLGTDMILKIQPLVRKMVIELSTLDMGLYKLSIDFSDILLLACLYRNCMSIFFFFVCSHLF